MNESPKKELSDKEARFVEEYLVDLNGTQAAIRAGYSDNPVSAASIAYQLLKKTPVIDALSKAKLERSERTRVTLDRVVLELARIGFANIKNYLDFGAQTVGIKDLSQANEDDLAAVQDVQLTLFGPHIRLYNKQDALKTLLAHLKSQPVDGEDPLSGATPFTNEQLIELVRAARKEKDQ